MMTKEKLRLAMICHFSNSEIRGHLPLDNRRLYEIARKILRMPSKGRVYGDIAPWDSNIIDGLRGREDVELHVVSAHTGLKKCVVSFNLNNVNYSFVRCDEATLLKRLVPNPSIWLKLNPMMYRVKKLVHAINPDIVLLFGAENAYISSTILGLESYPRMVMCQTIYNNPKRHNFSEVDSINAYIEKRIIDGNKYFSLISTMHRDLLLNMHPNAFVFHWDAITPYPNVHPISHKKYDFVNFAMGMSQKKGFPDVIEALAIVKQKYPNVTLNLVGGGSLEEKTRLLSMADNLGVKDNVEITPFFAKQEDLFQHLQNSRYAVLPCKMDYIAGTMMQSMHYGLPLIVYKTEGTPTLNSEGECVLIAQHSDVEDLAKKMMMMLQHPDKAEQMATRAKEYEKSINNRTKAIQDIVEVCFAIVNHEKNGVEIRKDLLFK